MKLGQKKREKRQKEAESIMLDYPEGNVSAMEKYSAPSTNIEFPATEPEVPRKPVKKVIIPILKFEFISNTVNPL